MPESPPDFDASSAQNEAQAADLALCPGGLWRTGSLLGRLRRGLAWTACGLAIFVAVLWAFAPVIAAAAPAMQMVAWVPEWVIVILIVGLGFTGITCWSTRRSRLASLFLILGLLIGPVVGTSIREYRWFASAQPGRIRLVFLNAQDPAMSASRDLWDVVGPLKPDILVISNPGFIAPKWRSMEEPQQAFSAIKWLSPFLVAVREGNVALRTMSRRDQVRAVAAEFESGTGVRDGVGLQRLAAIDLPSNWSLNRDVLMERLVSAIEAYEASTAGDFDLIVGDFNSTPRSPSRVRLGSRFRDGFELAGAGWGGTWPRGRPAIRIDAVYANRFSDLSVESVWTFDPRQGGHCGLVVDLGMPQPSISK